MGGEYSGLQTVISIGDFVCEISQVTERVRDEADQQVIDE
jgi:hypothetical protein